MTSFNDTISACNAAYQEGKSFSLTAPDGQPFQIEQGKGLKRKLGDAFASLDRFFEAHAADFDPVNNPDHRAFLERFGKRIRRAEMVAVGLDCRIEELLASCKSEDVSRESLPYNPEELPLADVVLEVGENKRRIPCHRIILARRSPFFKGLFEGAFREGAKHVLKIEGIKEETFLHYLNGVYQNLQPKALKELVEVGILADYFGDEDKVNSAALAITTKLAALSKSGNEKEIEGFLQLFRDTPLPTKIGAALVPTLLKEDPRGLTRQYIELMAKADLLPGVSEADLYRKLCSWEEAQLTSEQERDSLIFEKQGDGTSLADFVRFECMERDEFLELVGDKTPMDAAMKFQYLGKISIKQSGYCVLPTRLRRDNSDVWLVDQETKKGKTYLTFKGHLDVSTSLRFKYKRSFPLFGKRPNVTISVTGDSGVEGKKFHSKFCWDAKQDLHRIDFKLKVPIRNSRQRYVWPWSEDRAGSETFFHLSPEDLSASQDQGFIPFILRVRVQPPESEKADEIDKATLEEV